MNTNHLLTFVTVAQLKSITGAAKILHIGQPAVSAQLKLLQAEVGEPLYLRTGHRIKLTSAGEGLLQHAIRLQTELQQAEKFVRNLQNVNTGSLHIGSTNTIASYYLPYYMVQLQTRYPGVEVFMRTGDSDEIIEQITELDIAFVEGSVDIISLPSTFEIIPWQQDEIVLIAPKRHPLAQRFPDGVPLSVFAEYPVIWREAGSGARLVVQNALLEHGIHVPVNIQVSGVAGIKESVRAGLGISFASSKALKHDNGELIYRRINPPAGLIWHLLIVAPKEKIMSRVTQAFFGMVQNIDSQNLNQEIIDLSP